MRADRELAQRGKPAERNEKSAEAAKPAQKCKTTALVS